MYTFKYDFFPDLSKTNIEDYYDGVLTSFLAALSHNGQIIDQFWNVTQVGEKLRFFCLTIDEDSLDSKYYNMYCEKYFLKLLDYSLREPRLELISKTIGMAEACSCIDPSYYILFTTSGADFPPVSCGDCNLPVPLYKLPKMEEDHDEYYTLFQWEGVYQACDDLFMLSGIGERFGYNKTSQGKSELTKDGLNICKEMSQKTGKPFYYFLRRYYSKPKETCPICNGKWELDEELHGIYAYKCDKCFILSEKPR